MLMMPLFSKNDCTFIGGAYMCNAFGMLALFLLVISPLTTILLSLDRLVALYRPLYYRSRSGTKVGARDLLLQGVASAADKLGFY